jgi:PAS domain S-box-containing protein
MADPLVAIDARGRVVDANNALASTFGYAPRDVIGNDLSLLVPGAAVSRDTGGALVTVGNDARPYRGGAVEVTGRRRNGDVFPVLLTVGESDEGEQPIFVCILHDLTDVRAAQRKIDAQARTIRRSFHELEAITRPASNDVELPLRRMAALGESLGDVQRGALARYASLQFDGLLAGLGDPDPIEHPRNQVGGEPAEAPSPNVPVDLDEVVRDVAADLAGKLEQAGGDLARVSLPVVAGDPRALRQLFWNLLDNAIKFRDIARPLEVAVEAAPSPDACPGAMTSMVVISVRDNGIGFDAADTAKVFEPFGRLHPRERYPGNGLGLFFCRKIVEGMGGTLTVASVPGQGSRFRIELPALVSTGDA